MHPGKQDSNKQTNIELTLERLRAEIQRGTDLLHRLRNGDAPLEDKTCATPSSMPFEEFWNGMSDRIEDYRQTLNNIFSAISDIIG